MCVYVEPEQSFNERSKTLLANAPNPRKWWSTVKTAVFGASSGLPPWVDRGGRQVWSANENVSLFSWYFDTEQYRNSFQHRTLVTLVQYSVLLLHGPALCLVCFWIWILMVEMILTECSYFFLQTGGLGANT